ncbi:MAG: putative toxin-antitoxin system toxin component, PIN family [Candidatus Omnitrophica bacterium]|nr:putative toxin-antitoxin system toxin component, PIN family [Candidatus Omnitrophota bacterium]
MKVILDTNVLVSAIFFSSGPPRQILLAWNQGKFKLVISPQIFQEYRATIGELQSRYPTVSIEPILDLLLLSSEMCSGQKSLESICKDPEDDKFIHCALLSGTRLIVSGDKHLLKVSGYQNIEVLRPRKFLEKHL